MRRILLDQRSALRRAAGAAPALAVAAAALLLALRADGPQAGSSLALFSFAVTALRGRV